MAEKSGFQDLRLKRLSYVDAARDNNFEEGLRSLLSELYPDNAHFIYELLQNAEDALATTVNFVLTDDRLTVTHDGQRPFSLSDIESITGIGNSTKRDDPTQIGKFGVGFKAVFAYTTRPQVLSGMHAFAIEDLFVPTPLTVLPVAGKTTFVLPFDRSDKPQDIAVEEVARGLTELGEKTLLFLNHIRSITYELPDGRIGIIEREVVDELVISIKNSVGDEFNESHWLRLTGPASVSTGEANALSVAAAFRMNQPREERSKRGKRPRSDGSSTEAQRVIVPLEAGDVSIYFPAVKEHSGLRFHIHAPFASTVARDSVRDDPGNTHLVEDIASLIVSALPRLRDHGLLTSTFLAALPNKDDQIGHLYRPIYESITQAFNEQELTPVWRSSDFAQARTLVASPSEFRRWLKPDDLAVLFELGNISTNGDQHPQWIRDQDGRAGKFLAGLTTIEFGWEEFGEAIASAVDADVSLKWAASAEAIAEAFASAVDADVSLERDEDEYEYDDGEDNRAKVWFAWLESKSDDALIKLYQLIGFGCHNSELDDFFLRQVPMIRLKNRRGVSHVKGAETYLPASPSDKVRSRVPVELAYFDGDEDRSRADNLAVFYRAMGVKRWDESARVEQLLADYRKFDHPVPHGKEIEKHLKDVREFMRLAATNASARDDLREIPFLLAEQSQGEPRWVTPQQVFIDLPFEDTHLSVLYPRVPRYRISGRNQREYANDREPYPLAGCYLEVDGIVAFLDSLGAKTGIEITKVHIADNPNYWSYRNLGDRKNRHSQQTDWGIADLDDIIASSDHHLLRSLWNTVVKAPASKATATYKANKSAKRHLMPSQLAQKLTSLRWVLSSGGDLKLPREVSVDDLPEGWEAPTANSLIYELDFGADAARRREHEEGVTEYLIQSGLPEDAIALLQELQMAGYTKEEIRDIILEHAAKARSPEGASSDPERRANVAALDAIASPRHTTSIRPRSVVEGQASRESKVYLREQYSTASGEMYCQACRKHLPFRTRAGEWYFEAVEFVRGREQVHTANALALCPLCAALYKHARGTGNVALLKLLKDATIEAGQASVEIPVVLDAKRTMIAFTGKHAIDLKASLRAAGAARSTGDDDRVTF